MFAFSDTVSSELPKYPDGKRHVFPCDKCVCQDANVRERKQRFTDITKVLGRRRHEWKRTGRYRFTGLYIPCNSAYMLRYAFVRRIYGNRGRVT